MAIPVNKTPQPPSYSSRALRDMEVERKRNEEERITGWTVIWTLFLFKMATVALIWYAAAGSSDGSAKVNGLLVATTWYWFIIPLVAISGSLGYRLRLRATRKRVAELKHAEFVASHPTVSSGTMDVELTDVEKARLRVLQQRRERNDGYGVD